jgi:hypothetical protein
MTDCTRAELSRCRSHAHLTPATATSRRNKKKTSHPVTIRETSQTIGTTVAATMVLDGKMNLFEK